MTVTELMAELSALTPSLDVLVDVRGVQWNVIDVDEDKGYVILTADEDE